MPSSSKYLFKGVRSYVTRAIHSGLNTLRQLHPTSMSEALNPQRSKSDRWKTLISESKAAIEKYLPDIDVDLACFIRCITFRAFLVVFLNVDPEKLALDASVVTQVTSSLSDFYDDSRGNGRRRVWGQVKARSNLKLPADLRSTLHAWLPRTNADAGTSKSSQSNLDRALPAYEALWRIIATIVVTCEDDESRALRWVMLDFRDNPWDRQYQASLGAGGKSVSAITDEVVVHLEPITHLKQPQLSNADDPNPSSESLGSLMSCIRCAFAGGSGSPEHADVPTVLEALKFAALLASMVIGRVGIKYEITPNEGASMGSQAPPWDRRKLRGPRVREPPYANSSRQTHSH